MTLNCQMSKFMLIASCDCDKLYEKLYEKFSFNIIIFSLQVLFTDLASTLTNGAPTMSAAWG